MNDELKDQGQEAGAEEAERTPQMTRRRAALGYDARSERRALRGAARRRKTRAKLWLVAGPAIVVIAVVVTLLVLLGGPDDQVGGAGVTTTLAVAPDGGGDLLVIEQDSNAALFVLVQSEEESGLALGLPGITLLKSADGFLTLTELQAAGDSQTLLATLAQELGVRAGVTASVSWPELREALSTAGIDQLPAEKLAGLEEEVRQITSGLAELLSGGESVTAGVWERLQLRGDSAQFRRDMGMAALSVAPTGWTSGALTGRLVQGEGFVYLEPDVDQVEILLAGLAEGLSITVEIQNGSGMVGIVEQAIAELEPLDYELVSAGNSEDFPNAGPTRIVVAPDAAAAAQRVQALLGAGIVTEDVTLDPGHIVIVLGKDYVPPVTTTESAP